MDVWFGEGDVDLITPSPSIINAKSPLLPCDSACSSPSRDVVVHHTRFHSHLPLDSLLFIYIIPFAHLRSSC